MKTIAFLFLICILFSSCATIGTGLTNYRPYKTIKRDGRERIHKTRFYDEGGRYRVRFFSPMSN